MLSFEKIIEHLKKYPEVMKINGDLEEEYWQRTREKARLSYVDDEGKNLNIKL